MGRALVEIEHQPFLDESLRNAKTNISKKSPYLKNEFLEVIKTKQDPRKFSVFWLTLNQNWLILFWMLVCPTTWQIWKNETLFKFRVIDLNDKNLKINVDWIESTWHGVFFMCICVIKRRAKKKGGKREIEREKWKD